MAHKTEERVALVVGADEAPGRAAALALAARGVRVVVTGENERALGEVVGEIANAAGKARHVVRDVDAAARRCVDDFGSLDIVIAAAGVSAAIDVAARRMSAGSVVAICDATDAAGLEALRAAAAALRARHVRANAVLTAGCEPEEAAEVVVFFCSRAAAGLTGQVLTCATAASPEHRR